MPNAVGEAFLVIRPDTRRFKAEATPGIIGSAKGLATAFGATLGIATLVKKAFVEPLQAAGDFQRTLQVLQAQSGATNAQMKSVSETAIRLGADMKLPGTSAGDAADAMFELAKAGLSVKQAQQAARGVLVASTAAQIDNAQAAEIVANALNAFALNAREAGRVSDLLAASANASASDIPRMAQALQQVGASAHALGVPIEDTVTALAELANAGIQGSDAGTSLKTMFQRLIPTTQRAKEEMQKLGVNAFTSKGEFVGLRSVADQFGQALHKLTPEQRAHAIQTIFGTDAQRAANIILGQGAATFDKLKGRVTEAGAAQKIATAQSKGFSGAMSGLQSTIETLQLKIGLALLPVMTDLARFMGNNLPAAFEAASRFIGGAADRIAELSAAFSNTQVIALGLVATLALFASPTTVILTLAAAAVTLYQSFSPLRSIVDAVTMALDGHLTVVVALAGGILAAVAAFRSLNIILAASQTVLVAVGIAAPAAAVGVAEVGAAASVAATEVGAATRAATAFNPLLLALSVGVGIVTAGFLSNTQEVTHLDSAYKSATDAVNGLSDAFTSAKRASEDVTFASHNLHAAQTSLIAAQQNYNHVLRDGNATALDRRQALDQLRAAQDTVKRSQNQLTDAEKKANEEHARSREALSKVRNATVSMTDATGRTIRALGNLGSESNRSRAAAAALSDKLRDYAVKASEAANKTGNMSDAMRRARENSARAAAAVAQLADYLHRLPTHKEIRITETTIRQVSTIETNRLRRFAGGPVRAGQPYVVGELRPELFVPDTDGRILPRVPGAGRSGASQTTAGMQVTFAEGAIVVVAAPGQSTEEVGRAVIDAAFERSRRMDVPG